MPKLACPTVIVFLAFATAASAQVPAGGEFRVNSYTTNRQWQPRLAMEPDGDFVVAWNSYPQDGSSEGAFAQRFAASGVPRGVEFRVNTYVTSGQNNPSIAVGSKGDFVVVWSSPQDGSGDSIQGRRYDLAGNPIGAEFLVNTITTGYQYRPTVGRGSDGRFVVSWMSQNLDGSGFGIAARRFDALGSPIGGDFQVNTYTSNNQVRGEIAVEANGSFVAVWEDATAGRDGSGSAIFGQRHDASGNRLGSEFRVNSYTTGNQRVPSVSVSPAGGFAVAWRSQFGDGGGYGVFSRRFDSSGNAVGNDFVVNTYTTGSQYVVSGAIAHDVRGNFVITWVSPGDGSQDGAFAQRFSAAGVRRGAEFRANTYTTNNQLLPSLASDSVGNFVISWSSFGQDGAGAYGVFAQRFGGLGPAALAVDGPANLVLEPGETVEVRPTWRNLSGAAQTFSATLTNMTGPAGASYVITDPVGDYGTVGNGATGMCTDCYAVHVSNPPTRPLQHWDASAVESIAPETQGQQKQWALHVGGSFSDVPTSGPFYSFIETLLHFSITGGCGPNVYCPGNSTTREQMAVFVLIAKEGAAYVPPACVPPNIFTDVSASSPFCRFIEELFNRGVVGGCGPNLYCPTAAVTREQMAVFVLLTLDPLLDPPACAPPNLFNDVPETSGFCRWIEELALRGVVGGCGGGNYCPASPVTREQMGVFINVTFGLTLYGP